MPMFDYFLNFYKKNIKTFFNYTVILSSSSSINLIFYLSATVGAHRMELDQNLPHMKVSAN